MFVKGGERCSHQFQVAFQKKGIVCCIDEVHKGPNSNQHTAVHILMASNDCHDELQINPMFTSRDLRQFQDPIGKVLKSKLWLSLEAMIKLLLTNDMHEPLRKMIPDKLVAPM